MSKAALQVPKVSAFAPWIRAVDSSTETIPSKDKPHTHPVIKCGGTQRPTNILPAVARAAKSKFLCCGANPEKPSKRKRSGVKTTSFSNRNDTSRASWDQKRESAEHSPTKNANMHQVPPADTNSNLGKVTHAYRSASKGTDRVHAAISNGSTDDLDDVIFSQIRSENKVCKSPVHWYP